MPVWECCLSRVEKELFSDEIIDSTQSNLSGEEWRRNLVDARSIVIRGAHNVKFNKNILTGLVQKSNKVFNRLCSRKLISEKELIF